MKLLSLTTLVLGPPSVSSSDATITSASSSDPPSIPSSDPTVISSSDSTTIVFSSSSCSDFEAGWLAEVNEKQELKHYTPTYASPHEWTQICVTQTNNKREGFLRVKSLSFTIVSFLNQMHYLLVARWPLVVFQSLPKSKQIKKVLSYVIDRFHCMRLTPGNKWSLFELLIQPSWVLMFSKISTSYWLTTRYTFIPFSTRKTTQNNLIEHSQATMHDCSRGVPHVTCQKTESLFYGNNCGITTIPFKVC